MVNSLFLKLFSLHSVLFVFQAKKFELDSFQLTNSSVECHLLYQFNISYLIVAPQSGPKNIDSAIYDIFLSIIEICGYDESIEELASFFGFTKEKIVRVIDCFGQKIPVVKVNKMPALESYQKIIFITILGVLLVVSVIGNSVLLFFLTQSHFVGKLCKKGRDFSTCSTENNSSKKLKVTDVFFMLIAFFDILFALYILPLQISDALNDGTWRFNSISCSVYSYLNYLMLVINMLILMSIAIDRYSRIVINSVSRKEQHRYIKKILNTITCSKSLNDPKVATFTTYLWLLALVAVSCLICLPYLIYSEKTAIVLGPNCFSITDDFVCLNSWRNNSSAGHIYKIVLSIFVYIFPIVILVYSYVQISITLNYSTQNLTKFYKKRLVKLLIIDFVLYLVCWFPFLIYMIFLCLKDLGVIGLQIEFDIQYYVFNLLFMGPITNVSLKWIFRTLCSMKRFKMDVTSRKKSRANLFKSVATVTPIVNLEPSFNQSFNGKAN
jgi:hypothetical protein